MSAETARKVVAVLLCHASAVSVTESSRSTVAYRRSLQMRAQVGPHSLYKSPRRCCMGRYPGKTALNRPIGQEKPEKLSSLPRYRRQCPVNPQTRWNTCGPLSLGPVSRTNLGNTRIRRRIDQVNPLNPDTSAPNAQPAGPRMCSAHKSRKHQKTTESMSL